MQNSETPRPGRPRSEEAREAVLHAVDDLLIDVGYAAVTMKGIAERAGVGRQTVYRWWATKAEVLLEASATDARDELAIEPSGDALGDLVAFLDALIAFLTTSAAGLAYRALLGEAQHDKTVARLLAGTDVLADSARAVLHDAGVHAHTDAAVAQLVGPVVFWVLSGHEPRELSLTGIARACLPTSRRPTRSQAATR